MMATSRKTKTPQGWRAEGASNTASDKPNHTPVASKLKVPPISIGTFDVASRIWVLTYSMEQARQRYADRRQLLRQAWACLVLVLLRFLGVCI